MAFTMFATPIILVSRCAQVVTAAVGWIGRVTTVNRIGRVTTVNRIGRGWAIMVLPEESTPGEGIIAALPDEAHNKNTTEKRKIRLWKVMIRAGVVCVAVLFGMKVWFTILSEKISNWFSANEGTVKKTLEYLLLILNVLNCAITFYVKYHEPVERVLGEWLNCV